MLSAETSIVPDESRLLLRVSSMVWLLNDDARRRRRRRRPPLRSPRCASAPAISMMVDVLSAALTVTAPAAPPVGDCTDWCRRGPAIVVLLATSMFAMPATAAVPVRNRAANRIGLEVVGGIGLDVERAAQTDGGRIRQHQLPS